MQSRESNETPQLSLQEDLTLVGKEGELQCPNQESLDFLQNYIGADALRLLQEQSTIYYRESKHNRFLTIKVFYVEVHGRVIELMHKERRFFKKGQAIRDEIELHFSLVEDFLDHSEERYQRTTEFDQETQEFMKFFRKLMNALDKNCPLLLKASNKKRKRIIEVIIKQAGLRKVVLDSL